MLHCVKQYKHQQRLLINSSFLLRGMEWRMPSFPTLKKGDEQNEKQINEHARVT